MPPLRTGKGRWRHGGSAIHPNWVLGGRWPYQTPTKGQICRVLECPRSGTRPSGHWWCLEHVGAKPKPSKPCASARGSAISLISVLQRLPMYRPAICWLEYGVHGLVVKFVAGNRVWSVGFGNMVGICGFHANYPALNKMLSCFRSIRCWVVSMPYGTLLVRWIAPCLYGCRSPMLVSKVDRSCGSL